MKKIVFIILLSMSMGHFLLAKENGFKIYFFNRAYTGDFELAMYDYDTTWNAFLQDADLSRATLLIDDQDIREYRWKDQILRISDTKIGKIYEKKAGLYQYIFIVTLNGKRMYAGRVISKKSAMAVKFPVIYYDDIYENNSLQIYPVHTTIQLEDIPGETRDITVIPAVKEHFQSVKKIK
ncbi:MAG: hypothetical protein LBQ60_07600 [Bacteroidales bacterium]|jgi:hypothetical protein|nr:hypothetical protein [Bacteroidales bacterium]